MSASGRRMRWLLAGTAVALAAVAVAIVMAIAQGGARTAGGPAPSTASPADVAKATSTPAPVPVGVVRMAVVGDSISYGDSPDFVAGRLGDTSWVRWAVGDDLVFAGGWARWGATTQEMAANVRPYDADVLVILAGTNDLASRTPAEQTAAHLTAIAETVSAARVVLVGIPPLEGTGDAVGRFNEQLEALAVRRGWEFVDAAAGLRTPEGAFREGLSADGVHPTVSGAQLLAAAIRAQVVG